ncbi:energy transducer TonB [Aquibium microcysteis]|uniref:energy transducer TonB n=1 Tax=Aquibium microcysteis TaxID=675281 RepID=UPI001EF227B5|nr:energy transducer TonB [Aquibium microcysteis]
MVAAVLALSAHVGAAAWLMHQPPVVAADEAPPAAIMIELADEPEAVHTEENEISEQMENAEASAPAEEVEAPDPVPEEIVEERVEPEPVEDVAEDVPEAEPVEQDVVAPEEQPVEETVRLPDAEVPLPTARPSPPEPRKEKPKHDLVTKERPRPQRQQAASQTIRQAEVEVRQGERTAARQSASGVSSLTPARWQSRLMAHLERRKTYPADARRRGEHGTVYVRFRIDDGGNVISVALARSSGYSSLDDEVLSLVRRASPVPAPPPGVNRTITAPVRFSVR